MFIFWRLEIFWEWMLMECWIFIVNGKVFIFIVNYYRGGGGEGECDDFYDRNIKNE